ncbi:SymE family type I addiction module toxin [Elizabethkingia meningoseptica]|uniref:SymE family type I addiction module toxin n=1 Tax=Elizabethkingia meningoseptica TaxID=238 RepID=UPI00099ABEC4
MSTKKRFSKRQMTLCGKTFSRISCNYVVFPVLTLTGKWLKESGFKVGQVVDIHYKTNKLVITIAETQRFDLED